MEISHQFCGVTDLEILIMLSLRNTDIAHGTVPLIVEKLRYVSNECIGVWQLASFPTEKIKLGHLFLYQVLNADKISTPFAKTVLTVNTGSAVNMIEAMLKT